MPSPKRSKNLTEKTFNKLQYRVPNERKRERDVESEREREKLTHFSLIKLFTAPFHFSYCCSETFLLQQALVFRQFPVALTLYFPLSLPHCEFPKPICNIFYCSHLFHIRETLSRRAHNTYRCPRPKSDERIPKTRY